MTVKVMDFLKGRVATVIKYANYDLDDYYYEGMKRRLTLAQSVVCLRWLRSMDATKKKIARSVLVNLVASLFLLLICISSVIYLYQVMYARYYWMHSMNRSVAEAQDDVGKWQILLAEEDYADKYDLEILWSGYASCDNAGHYWVKLAMNREDLLRFREGWNSGEFNRFSFALSDERRTVYELDLEQAELIEREANYTPENGIYRWKYGYFDDNLVYSGIQLLGYRIIWLAKFVKIPYAGAVMLAMMPYVIILYFFLRIWRSGYRVDFSA